MSKRPKGNRVPRGAKRRTRQRPEWTILTTEHLELARTQMGMSKAAWARELSISIQSYHAWLARVNTPTVRSQEAIVERLRQVGAPLPEGAPAEKAGSPADDSSAINDLVRQYAASLIGSVDDPSTIPELVERFRESIS